MQSSVENQMTIMIVLTAIDIIIREKEIILILFNGILQVFSWIMLEGLDMYRFSILELLHFRDCFRCDVLVHINR